MSSLGEQAAERRARLAALRNKRKQPEVDESSEEPQKKRQSDVSDFKLKSRNFDPESRSNITGLDVPPTALDENSETVEAVAQRIQDEVLLKFRRMADDILEADSHVDRAKIKSRSIAWDMKRDIQQDLDLLQEKTDDAIKSIVKDRIRKLREDSDNV